MTFYVVYNSQGQFFARFSTFRRASLWTIRNGMEWTAIIKKEKEDNKCNQQNLGFSVGELFWERHSLE